jgi:sigma-B regulation protein RsbU (phosphoserine phosphatase)
MDDRSSATAVLAAPLDREEEAGRARRAWLAHTRYELRTPVNAIVDYTQMLLEDAGELGLGELVPELEKIQAAGADLVTLVAELLDPARGDAGLDVASEELAARIRHDLRNPLNAIIGYSEMLLEEAGDEGDERVAAELQKIRAAGKKLLLLIDDIVRFPQVEAGRVELRAEASGVAAMVQEVVASIRPLEADERVAAAAPSSLLVVDDSETSRHLLTRRLERQGYTVTTAVNGRQALELVRAQPFDLLLLDIMMPELNGYQVLETLKADPTLKHLPVIMISALDEIDSVVRCVEMGADDYLPKPFNPTLLRARIGASLEKKRLRDQEQRTYQALLESQKQLAAELVEAAEYVRSLLPAPLSGEVATDWRFQPSTQLGGDSFGYHWIDPEHFAIYLLDVCGHGVGAALLSVSAMNVLRSQALPDTDFREPSQVLQALNRTFQMKDQNNIYFTIWYGVYQRARRTLAFASGGHPPAILLTGPSAAETEAVPLRTRGPIIGALPEIQYKSDSRELGRHSRLFVFSDGTYEVTRPDGSMMDFEEFVALLSQPADDTPVVERILRQVQGLHGSDSLEDDFSLVEVVFQ